MSDTASDRRPGRLLAGLLCLGLLPATQANAYETDQFTHRLEPLTDSTELLNEQVNDAVAEVVEEWRWDRDELKFCYEIYQRLGGRHWVDRLERWAMDSPRIDRIEVGRRESIYWGHPLWATRVAFFFGIGATVKVNDILIGSDKFGHFFSQGLKFYRRWRQSGSEREAARHSAFTERALFGQSTTGSYSNADLVANYEGHRFYRSLFEDDVIDGKPAILAWDKGRWVIQRPFDWRDHVNAYWDEALNISHFDELLRPHMEERLREYCDDYEQAPDAYEVPNDQRLRQRYRHLQLRDTSELRLSHLCTTD